LHVHKYTKAHLDLDPQLLSVIVYVSIKLLFTIEIIQLKFVKVLKSWKIPTEKFCRYQGLNLGLQLPIMSLMQILLNSIDADMKSEIGSSRGGLRPYPLRFHVEEAGADAKLYQHGPLGVAYHRSRHPISTVQVARITANTTVPSFNNLFITKIGTNGFWHYEFCARSNSFNFLYTPTHFGVKRLACWPFELVLEGQTSEL
jgi:hypothetical protein